MPAQQLLEDINQENGYGVFLMAQMDSVPETLQFVIATTAYDTEAGGLRDKSRYIIRAIGVQEHRISMGIFGTIAILDDHPLLYQYNHHPVGVFFRGEADNQHELILDIIQGYASTFEGWRQIPRYLNVEQPLVDLVRDGGGLLGEMPRPLAERMVRILEHHQLETKLVEGERSGEQPPMKLMLLDDAYVVAMDFTVDGLGKVENKDT